MNRIFSVGLAAATLAGSLAAVAAPAAAQDRDDYNGGYYQNYDRGDYDRGDGDQGREGWRRGDRDDEHYGYGYNNGYGQYGYGGGYRTCTSRQTVWSSYYGRYIVRSYRYAC
ncbi:MAG: hypothetical protein ACYC8V_01410 [Caulobacteraceae bacterium]